MVKAYLIGLLHFVFFGMHSISCDNNTASAQAEEVGVDVSKSREQGGHWRCGRSLSQRERPLLWLSWILALSGSCLAVGIGGLSVPVTQIIPLVVFSAELNGETDQGEMMHFEMFDEPPADAAEPETLLENTLVSEPEPLLVSEPDALPEEASVPTLVEALDSEAVYDVPEALPVDAMLEVKPPVAAVATKPATERKKPVTTAPARSPSSAPPTGASGSPSTAVGNAGGSGTRGKKAGRNYFPAPSYPRFAESRGMRGQVSVHVQFGADGRPSSVRVTRSSGYSELDAYAVNHVKSRWKAGSDRHPAVQVPFHFQLMRR